MSVSLILYQKYRVAEARMYTLTHMCIGPHCSRGNKSSRASIPQLRTLPASGQQHEANGTTSGTVDIMRSTLQLV